MQTFSVRGIAFIASTMPRSLSGEDPLKVIDRTMSDHPDADVIPSILYWDVSEDQESGFTLSPGRGGFDSFLLDWPAMVEGIALRQDDVTTDQHETVRSQALSELRKDAARRLRSPATRSLYIPRLVGIAQGVGPWTVKPGIAPPASTDAKLTAAEGVTVVIHSARETMNLIPLLDSISDQALDGEVNVIVLLSGRDAKAIQTQAHAVTDWYKANKNRLMLRRYALAGEFLPGYLANMGIGLATTEAVVMIEGHCRISDRGTLATLATLALRGGVASVCAGVSWDSLQLASGLGLGTGPDGDDALAIETRPHFAGQQRLVAAPTPWLFAIRRSAWLAEGGIQGIKDSLWTAPMAGLNGPKGKHILSTVMASRDGSVPQPSAVSDWMPALIRKESAMALRVSPILPTLQDDALQTYTGRPTVSETLTEPIPGIAQGGPGRLAFCDALPADSGVTSVLIVADQFGASQSIAFIQGLASARRIGRISVAVIEEKAVLAHTRLLADTFEDRRPDIVVVSRMGDANVWTKLRLLIDERGTPLVFHLDDDLLDPPVLLGIERYRTARHPLRLHTLHQIARRADRILVSTPVLADRLSKMFDHSRICTMPIGSGASVPARRQVKPLHSTHLKIGYMGSASHNTDLSMIVPALNRVLKQRPGVEMVLFGSIARQPSAKRIEGSVNVIPGIFGDYAAFRARLASLNLDIGLAPLVDHSFNRSKTATKWVEYAEAGIAVLASPVGPYRTMAKAGAIAIAQPDQWEGAMLQLIDRHDLRRQLIDRSDALLTSSFDWERLETGVTSLFETLIADKE